MLNRRLIVIAIMGALLIALGCNGTRPIQGENLLDRNWGRSYETAKYNQMLNPDAGKNLEPVVGFDGTAAANNSDKYRDSFKEQEGSEVVNILKLQ
jgi:hypothetical protein